MNSATARQRVITELYDLYVANGFITEDVALACFVAHEIPLSEVDSITEHLLGVGVLIRLDDDEDEDETFSDHSKLDYNDIFNEVLETAPGLEVFIEYIRGITPPQHREWQKLIPQVQSGNEYARTRLIEMYLRTVIKQALYYSKRQGLPLEDTIQDGILGILIAVDKFDPTSHEKFSTYAPWWIGQSIARRRWVPGNSMYFPVHAKDKVFQIQEHVAEHICEKCRDNNLKSCPTLRVELSEKYDMSVDEAKELVFYLKQCCSLDAIEEEAPSLSDHGLLRDMLSENTETSAVFIRVKQKMDELTEKEQRVLYLRYGLADGDEKTLEAVGIEMNVTRERIRQIESKALRKLRKKLGIKAPTENEHSPE